LISTKPAILVREDGLPTKTHSLILLDHVTTAGGKIMARVSIVKCSDYENADKAIGRSIDLLGGLESIVKPGDVVLIKPNIFIPRRPETGVNTDPRFVASLVRLIKKAGAKRVLVGENPALNFSNNQGRPVFRESGMEDVVLEAGGEIACFDEEEYVEVEIPGGKSPLAFEKLRLPKTLLDANVYVNVPKFKTHNTTLLTLCLKNQWGLLLSEDRMKSHREDIHQALADLLRVAKPNLSIIDGIVAMEGAGPGQGELVNLGLIFAGDDPVATDAVATSAVCIDPMDVKATRIAHRERLGCADLDMIEVLGESIESIRRPIKKPEPDVVGAYSNVIVYMGGGCGSWSGGCSSWVRCALDILNRDHVLDKLGIITIVQGFKTKVPAKLQGRVFVVGDCAEEHRKRGTFIPGCPPWQAVDEILKLKETLYKP